MRKYSLLLLMTMGLLSVVGIAADANGRWALGILYSLFILTVVLVMLCTRHITRHSSTMINQVRNELQRSASELNAEMQQIAEQITKQSHEFNSKVSDTEKYLEEQITSFSHKNTMQAEFTNRKLADLASQHGKQIEESIRSHRIAIEAAKTSIETRMRVFEERPNEQSKRLEDLHQDDSITN